MFFDKSDIHKTKKRKAPARKPANSRPESGSTPDGRFFKIRELANSKLFLSEFIKKQWLGFIHIVKKASMIDCLKIPTIYLGSPYNIWQCFCECWV